MATDILTADKAGALVNDIRENVENQREFGADNFAAVAKLYGHNPKVKALVDALCGLSDDKRENALVVAQQCIEALEAMALHGSGYIPPRESGFGSDNASIIARMLLGQATTRGATRKLFAGIGKNAG